MRGLMDEQAFVLTEPTGLRLQSLAQVVFSDLLFERKHSAVTQMYMIRVLPLTYLKDCSNLVYQVQGKYA